MGFFLKQWESVWNGIWITSRREKGGASRAETYGGAAKELLFVEFPELLDRKHGVTKWMRKLVEFVEDVKKGGGNCIKVLYNELTQDMAEEREVHRMLGDLKEYWDKMPKDPELRKVEKATLLTIARTLKSDDGRERFEYKELLAVMHELANITNEHEDLMDIIRTFAKKRADLGKPLEKVAWRFEIGKVRRLIRGTRALNSAIKSLMASISRARESTKSAEIKRDLRELEADLQRVSADVAAMYKESWLVKERAFLLFMKLLYIAEQCEKYVDREVEIQNAPPVAKENLIERYKDAVRHLSRDLQVVAQEYRILIHDLERDINEADRLASIA